MINAHNKFEVAEYLTKLGYKAEVRDGIVSVLVNDPMPLVEKNKIRNILQSINYVGSWGWKLEKEKTA